MLPLVLLYYPNMKRPTDDAFRGGGQEERLPVQGGTTATQDRQDGENMMVAGGAATATTASDGSNTSTPFGGSSDDTSGNTDCLCFTSQSSHPATTAANVETGIASKVNTTNYPGGISQLSLFCQQMTTPFIATQFGRNHQPNIPAAGVAPVLTAAKSSSTKFSSNATAALRAPQSKEEEAINQALNQLSIGERQQVYRDIYGTPVAMSATAEGSGPTDPDVDETTRAITPPAVADKEDASMLADLVIELDGEIHRLVGKFSSSDAGHDARSGARNSGSSSIALIEAFNQNSTYVLDRNLLSAFLRSEDYDVKASINRMVSFYEQKKLLFGADKLTKHITLENDFDSDDMACLESGSFQYIPKQDRFGRHIIMDVRPLQQYKVFDNFVSEEI